MGNCVSGTGRTHPQLKMVHHSRRAHQHIAIVSRRSIRFTDATILLQSPRDRHINHRRLYAYHSLSGTYPRYKQQKYNLLREESEGYSKLITELASGTADEDDDKATEEKASTVLTHVQSLIGMPSSTIMVHVAYMGQGKALLEKYGTSNITVIFSLHRLFRSGSQQSFGHRSGCVFCKHCVALPLLHTLLADVSMESESAGTRNSRSRQDLRANPGLQISDSSGMAYHYGTCPWRLGCTLFA